MIHHPIVLIPKVVVLLILVAVLIVLHSVLSPSEFRVAVFVASGLFIGFCVVLWVFVIKTLKNPQSKLKKASVLSHQARAKDGFTASRDEFASLVGKRGVTLTPLNPSGKAEFDGRRIPVLTDAEFIDAGVPVEVIEAKGSKVVVKAVEPSDSRQQAAEP